jgi:hypothetical protein
MSVCPNTVTGKDVFDADDNGCIFRNLLTRSFSELAKHVPLNGSWVYTFGRYPSHYRTERSSADARVLFLKS